LFSLRELLEPVDPLVIYVSHVRALHDALHLRDKATNARL